MNGISTALETESDVATADRIEFLSSAFEQHSVEYKMGLEVFSI